MGGLGGVFVVFLAGVFLFLVVLFGRLVGGVGGCLVAMSSMVLGVCLLCECWVCRVLYSCMGEGG